MRPIDRLRLIDDIGRHLQASMSTTDINTYLKSFGVKCKEVSIVESKRIYVKDLLSDLDNNLIIRIAQDLSLDMPLSIAPSSLHLQNLLDDNAYAICRTDFDKALLDVETSPENAIGMASTTLESICKALLDAFEQQYPKDESLQPLLKAVFNVMKLSPESYADPDIKRVLGGLSNVGQGIAVLRTKYSSFHGKGASQPGLGKRHARLAVNSLATVGLFLLETYKERFESESSTL